MNNPYRLAEIEPPTAQPRNVRSRFPFWRSEQQMEDRKGKSENGREVGAPSVPAAVSLIHPSTLSNGQPVVQVKDVVKSFTVGGKELQILKGVSMQVQAGEFVSIVGPSGNGKSTLLNMITGIDRPTRGEIIVTGRAIDKMSENEMAVWRGSHVGIIFQFFQMLPTLSLLQNVVLPMEFAGKFTRRERLERAGELLELVGLGDQRDKLPSMVSGGQQQRAAIARALANDPPLLVGDEPTGNLDSRTAGEVFDLFLKLVDSGKTMLMVTHDRSLAARMPRTVEIVNGLITADTRKAA
ncbi:MAG: ABC transporter ATP-binding protein [Caldilineaceae bacterium]